MRADGERNRLRLIKAAKRVFAEKGASASLDQIARDAELGIGTLYRHFPTRDALVEAVYRQETEALLSGAAQLSRELEPVSALREWLRIFVEYLASKQGMSEALKTLIGGTETLYGESSAKVRGALDTLVTAAVETGEIRMHMEPLDLLRAIAGVANLSPAQNWKRSAVLMVDVLLDGLRTEARRADLERS
nr:TetR/AcrR family transcriptional regulator [Methylobacterium brachythecii]